MKYLEILNNRVLMTFAGKRYEDTLENFKQDGGTLIVRIKKIVPQKINLRSLIYDEKKKRAIINGEFESFPVEDINKIIEDIDLYIQLQGERCREPQSVEQLRNQALNHNYQQYYAKKSAIVWLEDGSGYGFGCSEQDQSNWLAALALLENDSIHYKVYTDVNDLEKVSLCIVTRKQLLELGNKVRIQQQEAYLAFDKIRKDIENSDTIEELRQYIS